MRFVLQEMSFFFFQAEDGIRYLTVTGVQTCALPISCARFTPKLKVGSGKRFARSRSADARLCSSVERACLMDGESSNWANNSDAAGRSEEHTSELQSQSNLVCRLLLEKKKKNNTHQESW